jgi:Zn2+/Cd2+-exporting ATPase
MIVAVAGAVASQEYQDAALVVTLFVAAELIESEVMRRVRNAVKLGVGGMPKSAILLNGDSVLVDDLKIGDKIATRAGDMILADGEITNGTGVVDESALTGEAIPIQKSKGDKVISGTVVQNGYLEILVETDPRESTVRKLNEKVAEVQTDRGRFASLVDRFAGIWTPIILLAAISLTCIAGGATGEWHRWSHRSLVLLVLACPCAIVIAAPIPSVCTIATAARHGVLIKGSSVVENLGVVDRLATDKTGTLTRGYFSVTASLDVSHVDCDGDHAHGHDHGHDHSHGHDHGHSHDDDDEENSNPIALAAALESRSAHPLANAIVSCNLTTFYSSVASSPPSRSLRLSC